MARKHRDSNPLEQTESQRWPLQFADRAAVAVSQSLVDHQGWAVMEAEWADQLADLTYRLVHDRSHAHDDFYRGQIAQLEANLGFRKELKDWRAEHK